jgi:hypothetical protein
VPEGAVEKSAVQRRLRADQPDIDVEFDEAMNVPKQVSSKAGGARLSAASAAEPDEVATRFIHDRRDIWNLTENDARTVEVVSVSKQGLRAVRLIQRVDGKEVFHSDVTVGLTPKNEVISVSGVLFHGTERAQPATRADASTSETAAIALATSDLTGTPYSADDFAEAPSPPDSGPYRFYERTGGKDDSRPRHQRPVRVKDVMFPLGDGHFVRGFFLELWVEGFPAFAYIIDAVGQPDELLYRKNLTSSAFRYRVHNTQDAVLRPHDGPAPGTPHPTGIPDGFQAATIPEVPVETDGLLTGDPWLAPGATHTDGNNCIAYADLTRTNQPGGDNPFGEITTAGEFDHSYDHSRSASDRANLQASLVGMFFHVNWLHDRWYEAGFDEASGNAQKDNFGRGGIGGDPILAEGNDASGTDNANMSTPPDGSSPRMQMFEFQGVPAGRPTRTSNHEALITFHEMGHYITNRLVGDALGLFNRQGRAMGEGWGDFFAICMTSQAADALADGAFAVGGWTDLRTGFEDNYYYSIRRYPYSADMGKNPLTFKHISDSAVLPVGPPRNSAVRGTNASEHNAGEVWCSMLWEVFVNLVAKHGHEEGERRVLRYVIGGLKLTPNNPTFTQARDGIIAAVSALDPDDLPEVWAGFAKRGIGASAVSPPSMSIPLSGVVESFQSP